MATRYYISLKDPKRARGSDAAYSFSAHGAEEFAAQLQDALRGDTFFKRWRDAQEDPDAVDPALGATDPDASVRGEADDLHVDLIAVTSLPGSVLKHRLRLLAGSGWELRDVSAACAPRTPRPCGNTRRCWPGAAARTRPGACIGCVSPGWKSSRC